MEDSNLRRHKELPLTCRIKKSHNYSGGNHRSRRAYAQEPVGHVPKKEKRRYRPFSLEPISSPESLTVLNRDDDETAPLPEENSG